MNGLPGLDVRFAVKGTPVPKGSMSGYPIARGRCEECKPGRKCARRNCFGGTIVGVSVTDQGDEALKTWQAQIHYAALSARNAARQREIGRPTALAVSMIFVMPRPASHWTSKGTLSSDGKAQAFPTTKPDLDKMCRACLDAITGVLAADDAQVTVAQLAEVHVTQPKAWTGVVVHARQMLSLDAWVEHELAYHGVWKPPEPSRQSALL